MNLIELILGQNAKVNEIDLFLHEDILSINLGSGTSTIEVLKVGMIRDRGLKITQEMLSDFVKNFESGTYGSDIQVNLGHVREGEAAGWIRRLFVSEDKLLAEVEWTPLGIEKIQTKQFRYTSSELALSLPHPQSGEKIKNVLIGVALTNIPAVKGLAPVSLSENLLLLLNSPNMDKCKELFNALMKKDVVSKEDLDSFNEAAKDQDVEEVGTMRDSLKGKMAKKVEKAADVIDAVKLTEPTVSLSEFNAMKSEMAALQEKAKETEKLREEIRMTKLNDVVTNQLMLSDTVTVGFPADSKEKVLAFVASLSEDQLQVFLELHKMETSYIAGVVGSSVNIVRSIEKLSEDKIFGDANKEAAKRFSQNPEKELHVHLSEVYAELGLDKVSV